MTNLLVEMAIREISTQCTFAEIAYGNITVKGSCNLSIAYSSIHSFLSHCANISQFLWSKHLKSADGQKMAKVLGITKSYKIKSTQARNLLEHYDKELKKWVEEKRPDVMIYDHNMGLKIKNSGNAMIIRHYEQDACIFTMLGEDVELDTLFSEVEEIKDKADQWVANNC